MSNDDVFEQQVAQLGVALSDKAIQQLLAYVSLLQKWNKTHNLTAVRNEQMLSLHLLDSLAILPMLSGKRVLDVGSGGGLPGIPLAIASPDMTFTLVDSNRKKTSFLRQAVLELQLPNVLVETQRIENLPSVPVYDCIVSRAYASLLQFVTQSRHVLAENGYWLAMKGLFPEQELTALPKDVHMLATKALQIPGLTAERHVLRLGVVHD